MIGAKFQAILGSISAPRDKDDNRTGSERRIDGFDQLITRILESGLPSDKGIRPHLSVIVDANTLDANSGTPAQLAGFGSIGPQLLGYIMRFPPKRGGISYKD